MNDANKKDKKIGYLWHDSSISDADNKKKTKKLGICLMVVVLRVLPAGGVPNVPRLKPALGSAGWI